MTFRAATLTAALALAASSALIGCDSTSHLTEQEHIQRAKDFEDQGKLNSSIIELKNAIQKNPDSPQARLLLGQVYLKNGSGAAAEKELTRARELGVSNETLAPQLGEALLQMGEYKRVLDEINPTDKTSRINLARIYQIRADAMLKQGQIDEACKLFERSLDTDNSHSPTYWGLAQCAIANNDVSKARSWLQAALKVPSRQAQTWVALGNFEQYIQQLQPALKAYTAALKVEPNNLDALLSRASLNMALGDLDAAEGDVKALATLAPKSLALYYVQALLSFEKKKYAEARASLDQAMKLAPDHMPSVLLAGALAHAQGAHQQAESLLNRFLVRYPHHAYARRVLASTQIRLNQPNLALETLAPLLDPDTRDAAALALASEAYRVKGSPAQTAAYLEKAAAIDPESAYIRTELGITHLSTGDRQLALSELGKATAIDPQAYRADYALILTRLQRKEYDEALATIATLEKKLPNSPLPHTLKGSAYMGKNDLASARRSFEKALAIDPLYFPAVENLAEVDMREKQPAAARGRYEGLLSRDPNNLRAMMALANIATTNQREQEAVRWLQKAVKTHPKATIPRAALVRYHLFRKEPQKALAIAREGVDASPNNPAALELLATVLVATNDFARAESIYTKLTRSTSPSPDAYARLARVQIDGNKLAAAQTTLDTALKLRPDHEPSLDLLITLEMKRGQTGRALQIARQIQTRHPRSPLGFEREGDIYLSQNNPAAALKGYEQALAKSESSSLLIKTHGTRVLTGDPTAGKQLVAWLEQHPRDTLVRLYAAQHYTAQGNARAAIAAYEALLALSPTHIVALNNLAGLYQSVGDRRALATAEKAYKLDPDNPAVLDTFGWLLTDSGHVARGLAMLEQALVALPKQPEVRYHHAAALARKGDTRRAQAALEALLKDAPAFPQAAAARRLLEQLK